LSGGVYRERIVIGKDNRRIVKAPLINPWNNICQIEVSSEFVSGVIGSAFFISPTQLLTAAHCIDDEDRFGSDVSSIKIRFPAKDSDNYFMKTIEDKNRLHTSPQWVRNYRSTKYDYGIIDLEGLDIQHDNFFELSNVDDIEVEQMLANIAGFPVDINDTPKMYHHAGLILYGTYQELHYQTDTSPGQSGSPIWIYETIDSDREILIGIHTAGDEYALENVGLRINEDVIDFIQSI